MSDCKTEPYLMLNEAKALGDSRIVSELPRLKSFNVSLRGTGVLHAKVVLKGSNINKPYAYVDLVTITMDGSTLMTDSGIHDGPWAFYKFSIVELSGTGASVDAAMGA